MKKVLLWFFAALFVGSFALTSCSKDDDDTTAPATEKRDRARYTILVYGNAGSSMDFIIENMWDELKPMLTDSTDVRMLFLYKYGANNGQQSGRYGSPEQVFLFELNSETDLENLRNTDAIQAPGFQLYNPFILSGVIDMAKRVCPADNYIFILWGHGGGFDVTNDAPNNIITKGVLYDELEADKGMSMYEFADALAAADNAHFQLMMFHNCLMGNIENITEVQQYADYFFVSSHVLYSNGTPIVELVKTLQSRRDDYDFEKTAEQFYNNLRPVYDRMMVSNPSGPIPQNQDHKIIRSSDLSVLNYYIGQLSERLVTLYADPEKAALIDQAAEDILYSYDASIYAYMVDLDFYVSRLEHYVDDAQLQELAAAIHSTLDHAIIQSWQYNYVNPDNGSTTGLDHYSLSIVFGHHDFMHLVVRGNTLANAYYPSAFNRRTGWANWLNTNTCWPSVRRGPFCGFTLPWDTFVNALSSI